MQRRPDGDHGADGEHDPGEQLAALVAPGLNVVFGLDDEVGRTQHGVTGHHAQHHDDAEGREPFPHAAHIHAVHHLHAIEQATEREPLGDGGQQAADAEHGAPEGFALGEFMKLERHAAQHEAQQHEDDRNVEPMQHGAVGQRKGAEQRTADDHQPGLVGVPDAAQAGHHHLAAALADEQRKHPHAEVETVEHHIKHHEQADDEKPHRGQNVMQFLRVAEVHLTALLSPRAWR